MIVLVLLCLTINVMEAPVTALHHVVHREELPFKGIIKAHSRLCPLESLSIYICNLVYDLLYQDLIARDKQGFKAD